MPKRRFTNAEELAICQRYKAGESTRKLGEIFGVDRSTISNILKRHFIETRANKTVPIKLNKAQILAICERYRAGENTVEIGKDIGCRPSTISRILKRHNVEIRSRKRLSAIEEQDLCGRYQDGETIVELGVRFELHFASISRILERNGVARRSFIEAAGGLSEEQEAEVCNRYKNGENTNELAEYFDVCGTTIINVLERNGVSRRTNSESKGGLWGKLETEICKRYEAKESSFEIAASFGVSAFHILEILKFNKVHIRTNSEASGGLTAAQESEVCKRYQEGENAAELGKCFGIAGGTIGQILVRNGIKKRTISEILGGLTGDQKKDICKRYEAGERNAKALSEVYGVSNTTIIRALNENDIYLRRGKILTPEEEIEACGLYEGGHTAYEIGEIFAVNKATILNTLKLHKIERRESGFFSDSVQHAIEGTGRFTHQRECEFYIYELARYSTTHCKPGIAFDTDIRVDEEYGEEALRLFFNSRQEAFFLEQAILVETDAPWQCPDDLWSWKGASEIRAMPAKDLVPIALNLANELGEIGIWEFATLRVPMTNGQRQQIALISECSGQSGAQYSCN